MNPPAPRKYLPLEGYRYLTLRYLAHRDEAGATKGQILWETRANHATTTRTLRSLVSDRMVSMQGDAATGFVIRLTEEGRGFLRAHETYLERTYGRIIQDHFRFGKRPAWLPLLSRP